MRSKPQKWNKKKEGIMIWLLTFLFEKNTFELAKFKKKVMKSKEHYGQKRMTDWVSEWVRWTWSCLALVGCVYKVKVDKSRFRSLNLCNYFLYIICTWTYIKKWGAPLVTELGLTFWTLIHIATTFPILIIYKAFQYEQKMSSPSKEVLNRLRSYSV